MNKALGVAVGIIMIAISFVVFPIILDSTTAILTDDVVATVASATTTADQTSKAFTVDSDVYENETSSVVKITSSNSSDNPTVSAVNGKSITVSGLAANSTRTLTITYQTAALGEYTGLAAIVKVAPLIIFVSIIGVALGGAYFSFKR